ncbi:MAG: hypothetical protein ACKVW3_06585 [Phycisphaerales bacterium]
MKLSKQRKACVAVLGLGLVALAADRALLGPSGASAAAVDPSELGPIPAEKSAGANVDGRKGPSLSMRLASLVIKPAERDGFTPPESWATVAAASGDGEGATAKFASSHKLTSIVSATKGEKRPVAIVNGKPLRVGERIGDFKLIGLTVDSATFHGEAGDVTLRLREPEARDIRLSVQGRADGHERTDGGQSR